ncbi:MAG TPA: Imm21 family immunity protein [Streptosporangiaceae bacterium]|nr:Imm21 family immunity protein [Streptosporangiaceae bacterium]
MSAPSPAAGGSAGHARIWVTSMGGPLLVVPVSALSSWGGCTTAGVIMGGTETPDDYDRACAVQGLAGAIAVGDEGARALVLADEPATSCYLPGHRAFLRWLAAGSEAELAAAANRVLADPATAWQDYGTWTTDGPAVLMDSANAGTDLDVEYPGDGLPDQAPVLLPAGTWRVRAVYAEPGRHTWAGLVHLLPTSP